MHFKNPSGQQAMPLLTTAIYVVFERSHAARFSLRFTLKMETFILPPHYHYDVPYYNKGLYSYPKLWVTA